MKTSLPLLALVLASAFARGNTFFDAYLDGPSEAPPVASPGVGYAFAEYNPATRTLFLDVDFSGLVGPTTVAHIHGPTAVAGAGTASVMTTTPTFLGFPAGVTAGSYTTLLDLSLASSYRAGFLGGFGGDTLLAEAALISALGNGTAYLNIHTSFAPGGEIRGFFKPVPEPGTWLAMVSLGALGAGAVVRRLRGGR
jgi:hypothetical protein